MREDIGQGLMMCVIQISTHIIVFIIYLNIKLITHFMLKFYPALYWFSHMCLKTRIFFYINYIVKSSY